jgi:hypothetical protein
MTTEWQLERRVVRDLLTRLLAWADNQKVDFNTSTEWQEALTVWANLSLAVAEAEAK